MHMYQLYIYMPIQCKDNVGYMVIGERVILVIQ